MIKACAKAPRVSRRPRRGLSLLEVIVALAIFLFAIVSLSQVATVSTNRALALERRSEASQLAQSKMAEVFAGTCRSSPRAKPPSTMNRITTGRWTPSSMAP